jgi:hypothetical protein
LRFLSNVSLRIKREKCVNKLPVTPALQTFAATAKLHSMATDYDATEFVDADFQSTGGKTTGPATATSGNLAGRAPTREEVETRLLDAQQKHAELKRAQADLERERANLEETRRRQAELQTGRKEITEQLTRGLGLLEEAEFSARRDAEQMAKTITDIKDALAKVQAINEESWTGENFPTELTRGLTTLENARMEWNSARLKFSVLTGPKAEGASAVEATPPAARTILGAQSLAELTKVGLALTWPLAAVVLGALAVLLVLLFRR